MRSTVAAILALIFLSFVSIALYPSILSYTGFMFILLIALSGVKVVQQYEKGVILRLGKFVGLQNPGLTYIAPALEKMIRVDTRVITIDVQRQEVMTKDNVPVMADAVVFYRIVNAEKAILDVQDYHYAISKYAQTALRDVVGEVDLDEVLSSRDKLAKEIEKIVDREMSAWGIDVKGIKVQHIELPADMKRAMARQAEAEREKRANIIISEGEFIASENFKKAAEKLSASPAGIQLRTLQTIESVSPDQSNTIVFTFPLEFSTALTELTDYLKVRKKSK
jgi:regulator of protease activity HflC (stomatin/prohibitin superfamily)